MRQEYVMGLMTYEDRVVLIRKIKPEWQAGLLNGVGGKIEPGEDPLPAMAREFLEETGTETTWGMWSHIATGENEHAIVHFFHVDSPLLVDVKTVEAEEVVVVPVDDVRVGRGVISNVPWILHLALESMNPTNGGTTLPLSFRF